MKFIIQLYSQQKKVITFFLFIGLFFIFLILLPPTKTSILPFIFRQNFSDFIAQTISENKIDTQNFWQLREFASPGYFILKKEGLDNETAREFIKNQKIEISTANLYPFLLFSSERWKSIEFLAKHNAWSLISSQLKNHCNILIFISPNEIICKRKNNSIIIAFIKSQKEMLKSNGFFDVKGRDGKIVEGNKWLVISVVK